MMGSWPCKVLLTAFAFVAKICALVRATLLFMHCSCIYVNGGTKHTHHDIDITVFYY